MTDELRLLRDQFPDYELTLDFSAGRIRFVSRSRRPSQNPYIVITRDPAELRAILHCAQDAETARISGLPPA